MYILILNNPKKVIGYTVWTGFGPGGSITDSFDDVAIQKTKKPLLCVFSAQRIMHTLSPKEFRLCLMKKRTKNSNSILCRFKCTSIIWNAGNSIKY